MSKNQEEAATLDINAPESMGLSPAFLTNRKMFPKLWSPKHDIEFDINCDEDNPKTVSYNQILKAACIIKKIIPKTMLMKSRHSLFPMELYYKVETFHATGSFLERGAVNALYLLTAEEKGRGVITASLGNWAMALAYHGKKLRINVTVVLPENTSVRNVGKCREYKAKVLLYGNCLADAKHHAFVVISKTEGPKPIYISGYDHPHMISGAGTIGKEIMDDLPDTDVILVPVGGGALIAGIAIAAKKINPDIKIYGVELDKSCCFFKALDRQRPFKTYVEYGMAPNLAVAIAGFNSYHNAKSLVDKMVLVESDWVARAIMHLVETEKIIAEGAGAVSLSALLAVPQILPELEGKKVVCIISGGNIDTVILYRCIERAKASEGKLIRLTVSISPFSQLNDQLHVISMISNLEGNVMCFETEHDWLELDNFVSIRLNLVIETHNIEHACSIKRVMEQIFPNRCTFLEEPFSPLPICVCFPKKRVYQ